MSEVKQVPTVGEIARRYDVALHRVEYAVRSRGIEPVGRAGNLRIFSEDQVRQIAEILGVAERASQGWGEAR